MLIKAILPVEYSIKTPEYEEAVRLGTDEDFDIEKRRMWMKGGLMIPTVVNWWSCYWMPGATFVEFRTGSISLLNITVQELEGHLAEFYSSLPDGGAALFAKMLTS